MTLTKHYKQYWIISYYSANLSSASILFPFLVSLRDLILVICLSLSLLTKKFFDTCLFLLDLYYCIVYTFVIEEKLIPSIYHKKNFLLGFTNLSIYRLTFLSCKRCPKCTEVRIIWIICNIQEMILQHPVLSEISSPPSTSLVCTVAWCTLDSSMFLDAAKNLGHSNMRWFLGSKLGSRKVFHCFHQIPFERYIKCNAI